MRSARHRRFVTPELDALAVVFALAQVQWYQPGCACQAPVERCAVDVQLRGGLVLQMFLEHIVVLPGGPAGDAEALLHLPNAARPV